MMYSSLFVNIFNYKAHYFSYSTHSKKIMIKIYKNVYDLNKIYSFRKLFNWLNFIYQIKRVFLVFLPYFSSLPS